MRKEGVLFILGFFIVLSFQAIYVSGASCSVTDRSSCQVQGGYVALGLSNITNAHGETANSGNYNYVLCCDFAGSTTCDSTNKIIGLSSSTNAHAEIPSDTNYLTDICYNSLTCVSRTNSCNTGELGVLSLSNQTNAHIGAYNDYNTKICCSISSISTNSLYWSDTNDYQITEATISPGTSTVRMHFQNSSIPSGTSITLDIYEHDTFLQNPLDPSDDFIRSIDATTGDNGTASADWLITQSDLDKTPNDYNQFYFTVNGQSSGYLKLNIAQGFSCNQTFTCSDYSSEVNCNNDVQLCGVAKNGVPSGVDCSDPSVTCVCSWDNQTSSCKTGYNYASTNQTTTTNYGTCVISEQQVDENGCADNFLTVSWTGNWVWSASNPQHNDPQNLSAKCGQTGTKVVECPTQVKLPFFGFYNMLAAAMLIAIIYFFISEKNRHRHKKS